MHPVPELRALPPSALAPKYRAHLVRAGLIHPSEALVLSPTHLARLTRLAPDDCNTLLDQLARAVLEPRDDDTVARLVDLAPPSSLTTGDPKLDLLLGGHGIRTGTLTELAGHSSSGKTHLCLQLALTAQLPPDQGGLQGGALFISSEGTVPSSRLFQLADHYARRLPPADDDDDARTAWDFLDNVHAEKAPDLDTLAAVLAYHAPACIDRVAAHAASHTPLALHLTPPSSLAPDSTAPPRPSQVVLASRPRPARPPLPVKLVVVDSLAAPFRADATATSSSSFAQRARDLGALGDSLKRLAAEFGCAVVVVNQVADAFSPAEDRPLHPAFLGAGAPHEQFALPVDLYSRTQTPHFSGLAASTSSAALKLPWYRLDDGTVPPPGGVQAALGHAWSNVPSTRILLLVRRAGGAAGGAGPALTRRAAALVWSPWAPRAVLETRLGEGGLEGVGDVCERAVLWVERGPHDADEGERPDDDDEVEAERDWWHSQAERAVREAELRALAGGGTAGDSSVVGGSRVGASADEAIAGGGVAQGADERGREDEEEGRLEPGRD